MLNESVEHFHGNPRDDIWPVFFLLSNKLCMSAASSQQRDRPPVALAFPSEVTNDDLTQLWVLPHPRSGAPAYYAISNDGHGTLFELIVTRPTAPASQSWFLREATSLEGQVVADGAMHILSRIDPAFVLLGILGLEHDGKRFWPLDDWAEAATDAHVTRRLALHKDPSSTTCSSQSPTAFTNAWPDITAFVLHPMMHKHLLRICSTQPQTHTCDGLVYRLDWSRVIAILDEKVDRLCVGAHDILTAQSARSTGCSDEAYDTPETDGIRRIAREWIGAYLARHIRERWASGQSTSSRT